METTKSLPLTPEEAKCLRIAAGHLSLTRKMRVELPEDEGSQLLGKLERIQEEAL